MLCTMCTHPCTMHTPAPCIRTLRAAYSTCMAHVCSMRTHTHTLCSTWHIYALSICIQYAVCSTCMLYAHTPCRIGIYMHCAHVGSMQYAAHVCPIHTHHAHTLCSIWHIYALYTCMHYAVFSTYMSHAHTHTHTHTHTHYAA